MDGLSKEFFQCMSQFSKLKMGDISKELSQREFTMLVKIDSANKECGGITISEIAEHLQALPPAISRSLNTLEERGLIERIVRKTDRRNTYVILTQEGEETMHRVKAGVDSFVGRVLEQIGEDEMKHLIHTMDTIYQISEKELEKNKGKGEK